MPNLFRLIITGVRIEDPKMTRAWHTRFDFSFLFYVFSPVDLHIYSILWNEIWFFCHYAQTLTIDHIDVNAGWIIFVILDSELHCTPHIPTFQAFLYTCEPTMLTTLFTTPGGSSITPSRMIECTIPLTHYSDYPISKRSSPPRLHHMHFYIIVFCYTNEQERTVSLVIVLGGGGGMRVWKVHGTTSREQRRKIDTPSVLKAWIHSPTTNLLSNACVPANDH